MTDIHILIALTMQQSNLYLIIYLKISLSLFACSIIVHPYHMNIFINQMKVGQHPKPKLHMLKNNLKNNYRTQQSSPNQLADNQLKTNNHFDFNMPQIARVTQRMGFGARGIKSLQNSKQKQHQLKAAKVPVFGLNILKNSIGHLDKQQILNYASGRKKKIQPETQRIITEKKNRLTEGSEKEDHLNIQVYGQKSLAQSKIKFRVGSKYKQQQKTEQILQSPSKKNSLQSKIHVNRKIISFPRSERLRAEGEQNDEHPKTSLSKQEKHLTPFEKQQLVHYEIYYVGPRRIHSQNDFSDNEGDPKVMIHDSIAYRYEIISQLGRGSFGRVFKAFDHKKKQYVALKIIKCQKKFQDQAKVQIAILQTALLKDPKFRSNIIRMKGSFVFRGHSCITFQILHKNLYEFLKEHQFAGFSHDLIRRFAIQILQALCFFKKNGIIHCDLKPQNILLKEQNKSGIRVIDVGSGCFQQKQIYTYIQSRFYRAPQIIFGIRYTSAIDMWSFGCILVELFTGFPIFPGQSQNEQVLLFMQALGTPPLEMLQIAERRKKFFDDEFKVKIPQQKGKERIPGSISIDEIVGSTDKSFLNLIRRCFEWNPKKRISPKQALLHQWILKGLPESIREQHIEQLRDQYQQ